MPGCNQGSASGRAEPAPPLGGISKLGWPCGENPGGNAEGDFLGGTRSARPRVKARRKPGQVMITDESAMGPWPKRGNIWAGAMPSPRACGACPSATRPAQDGCPGAKSLEITGRRFSRRDALCASALQGRIHAEASHYPGRLGKSPEA